MSVGSLSGVDSSGAYGLGRYRGTDRRIVRHVGSVRDEAELGLLIEEARRLLADDAQHELDLGITPKALKAEMVPLTAETLFVDATVGLRRRSW